jgi:hypothetical protein
MHRWTRALLFFLLFSAGPALLASEPENVSLIQLIATPEKYEGKQIRVVGALWFEFEEQALYLHTEDRKLLRTENAVWLKIPPTLKAKARALSDGFALVEGRFSSLNEGHFEGFAGSVDDVRRLDRALTREELSSGRGRPKETPSR